MILQAIGAVLPASLAIALSPFPLIGVVVILSGEHARRSGAAFAAGWLVGMSVITVLGLLVLGEVDASGSSTVVDVVRVLAGTVFVVLGLRTGWTSLRSGAAKKTPGWLSTLDGATPRKALSLGVVLSAANPKILVLVAAAATAIVETDAQGGGLVLAAVVFVVLSSWTVVGAVVVHAVGGRRAAGFLERVREFMIAHGTAITVAVLLLLGANILGSGLSGLGE